MNKVIWDAETIIGYTEDIIAEVKDMLIKAIQEDDLDMVIVSGESYGNLLNQLAYFNKKTDKPERLVMCLYDNNIDQWNVYPLVPDLD